MWRKPKFTRRQLVLSLGAAILLGSAVISQREALFAAPKLKIENPHEEPPAEYVLNINGKPVSLTLNKEVRTRVGNRAARLKLSRKPTRTFDKAGVRFSYPVGFVFQADTNDPEAIVWTMTGNNSFVMLNQFERLPEFAVLAAVEYEALKQYPPKSAKVSPTSIVLGSRKISGKRMNVTIAGAKILQDYFVFSNGESTFALMFQDDLTATGKPTTEGLNLRKMVSTTFRFQ